MRLRIGMTCAFPAARIPVKFCQPHRSLWFWDRMARSERRKTKVRGNRSLVFSWNSTESRLELRLTVVYFTSESSIYQEKHELKKYTKFQITYSPYKTNLLNALLHGYK